MDADFRITTITFKQDGVHLDSEIVEVNVYHDAIGGVAYEITVRRPKVDHGQPIGIGFNPFAEEHRISVKADRSTHLGFIVNSAANQPGWLFCEPGFKLKDGVAGGNRFSNKEIIYPSRRATWVTYTPQPGDAGSQYHYELHLEAPAWENGQPNGHMIVIIDPIIGSEEV